jgi:predicted small lipoprotein YifL
MIRSGVAVCAPARVVTAVACLTLVAIATAGCGRKGPPLVPLVRIPAPVEDLTLRRVGDEVFITFTVPDRNLDGSTPPDVTRVDVLAIDGDAPPPVTEFSRSGARVSSVAVSLPSAGDAPTSPPAPGPRSAAPGERITVRDTLAPAAGAEAAASRFYVALAYGPRDRTSPAVGAVALPSGPAPEPPDGLSVTFSADAISLSWTPSEDASGYHVYRTDGPSGGAPSTEPPAPVTTSPLEMPAYSEPVGFGVERCYWVRSISAGEVPIESAASAPTCITPEDIFPPSAPTELTAVAGPDGIALRWAPSPEPDVAGYVVLRGTTADDTLLPITDVPVAEPRLLDRDVVSGVRYVYAVVAVDRRQPAPNRSPESPRDAVTAR